MPYFKNDYINILFIHIPKTGGMSLESYFSSKYNIQLNNESLYSLIDEKIKSDNNMMITSTLQHITYNQMVKYNNIFNIDFNNIKIITIVRNPYERIISDLFFYSKIDVNTSKNEVYDLIKQYVFSTDYDNHNIPQYMFITDDNTDLIPDINILHTETLNDDMKNLGFEDFDVWTNNNTNKVDYYNYLNNESIEFINNFYHLDFVLFNYDKR